MDNENNSDTQDISELLNNLVEQYPNPLDFVHEINFILDNTRMDTNTKLDSLYNIGTYLYSKFQFNHAISILENLISLVESFSIYCR